MKLKSSNIKWIIGFIYLLLLIVGITFLLSKYNISDFFSYEFIRLNKDVILEYRRENFLILTILFFTFSIVWVLMLGFAMPLLIFAGFVFGKWWGILIVLTSTTIGATILYFLVGLFFVKRVVPIWNFNNKTGTFTVFIFYINGALVGFYNVVGN